MRCSLHARTPPTATTAYACLRARGAATADTDGSVPLFDSGVVTLWGNLENVLVVLDTNTIESDPWFLRHLDYDNAQFVANVVDWVSVPEPSTFVLLGIGAVALFGVGRRRCRM